MGKHNEYGLLIKIGYGTFSNFKIAMSGSKMIPDSRFQISDSDFGFHPGVRDWIPDQILG